MDEKTYITKIHIREFIERRTPDNREFSGWLEGAANYFPTLASRSCMTPSQAIAWRTEVEKEAWRISNTPHIDINNNPVKVTITTETIFENF
jgi:hypothetical protein